MIPTSELKHQIKSTCSFQAVMKRNGNWGFPNRRKKQNKVISKLAEGILNATVHVTDKRC